MSVDKNKLKKYIQDFNFKNIFLEELGWDRLTIQPIYVKVDNETYKLVPVAQKRGFQVFESSPNQNGEIPNHATRTKIDRELTKSAFEHIIIFTNKEKTSQKWQWIKREQNKPLALREENYIKSQSGERLIQKIANLFISFEEEEKLLIGHVTSKAKGAFDIEKITKKFYEKFQKEHLKFSGFLKGIPDQEMQRWYVSVMINRLMFIYFIQKKGFLDNNLDYLRTQLSRSKAVGENLFYNTFLCPLFFEGLAKKEVERSTKTNALLGKVPYLNGGIFQRHEIEQLYGQTIKIEDKAFEDLFDFFEQYQWHLDDRPLKKDNEINPDVLGYIFEKYINQKQMGAYYTKEDITEYISKNTIIPFLLDATSQDCKIAFEGENSIWRLLKENPDKYIYDAVKHGTQLELPLDISVGLEDVSKRTEWNKPALSDYALPTEIWREVIARRKRYEEVHSKLSAGEIKTPSDLITYNLNIRQFAQDVIDNSEGPELIRAFYKAIEKVTILDPTCGSGAFLFAALNILEPLYESCLERMQGFLEELEISTKKQDPGKFADFRKTLEKVQQHPNRRYFIFKSIVINNLYGVDIMEEATEICKLRLFLKLISQIDDVSQIEPLPDIDFNILAGNTLVGFATYNEVEKAVNSKLDFEQSVERIEEKAQELDKLFQRFRLQQTELGGEVNFEDKQELQKRLKALENELNQYLAIEYKVPKNETSYKKWLTSHKPFHWFIEFYGIIKKGGFDVIIGNPPYVEYGQVKNTYKIQNYATESCGNLYAFITERCNYLANQNSNFSFIVPSASCCTPRMLPLVEKLLSRYKNLWISLYDERPAKLFENVDQQLSIQIGCSKSTTCKTFITPMRHWVTQPFDQRNYLFQLTSYADLQGIEKFADIFPKLGEKEEVNILAKLRNTNKIFLEELRRSNNLQPIYYRNAGGRYWRLIKSFPSYFKTEKGSNTSSTEFSLLVDKTWAPVLVCLYSSSLFYWFWRVVSNCRHLTNRELNAFPITRNLSSKEIKHLFVSFQKDYEEKLQLTAKRKTTQNKSSGQTVQDEYYISSAKNIIDEIDKILAQHYGFTDEELDFIINYDIKYRMGQSNQDDEE